MMSYVIQNLLKEYERVEITILRNRSNRLTISSFLKKKKERKKRIKDIVFVKQESNKKAHISISSWLNNKLTYLIVTKFTLL